METDHSFDQLIGLITRYIAEQESDNLKIGELAELSMRQIVYLETIAALGEPTFSDLAHRLGISKPSVTAIVDKLIQKGYLERVQSDADRRVFHVHLTEKGRHLSETHHAVHARIAGQIAQALSGPELAEFARLLQKIIQSIHL
jgi:DNA-binding MarR family transcriptional regulator